jgi:UDP:flavonoid glycosyltransferase YjiC (YdhE family)
VAETGFGIRLATYEFEDRELLDAIDRLLADRALHERMGAIASRVQASPGTVRAADLIERLARDGQPVVG